ncbi:pyridoxamine 5'-phosphate oxidase family protein [Modestobacter sp. SYSU DS0875]
MFSADPDPDRELEVLRASERLRLLATRDLGRIAFTDGALPVLQPVTYLLSGQELIVPVSSGSDLAAAAGAVGCAPRPNPGLLSPREQCQSGRDEQPRAPHRRHRSRAGGPLAAGRHAADRAAR